MPIRIEEMHTSVEVVDSQALLSPAVLARIVEAVVRRLAEHEHQENARDTERDLRSVVEQQRATGGW
jgi:hypothetical protein